VKTCFPHSEQQVKTLFSGWWENVKMFSALLCKTEKSVAQQKKERKKHQRAENQESIAAGSSKIERESPSTTSVQERSQPLCWMRRRLSKRRKEIGFEYFQFRISV
jgi:hypothetical protein